MNRTAISDSRALTGAFAVALAGVLAAALCVSTAAAAPASASAKSCSIASVSHKLGPTAVTSLKVTNVSCAVGIAVVKAYQHCRLAKGKSGRCVKTVLGGYACREARTNGPTQFTATATCALGKKVVTHRYTQVL